MFNALQWGPDGWLWGCNGILSNSQVGKPGTPDAEADADQLRRLALSPDARGLRGRRARDDQPLGARLRRLRRGVHHQLRDPAPVPRRPRRPLPAHVRPGLQPVSLRPDARPAPTTSTGPAAAGPTRASGKGSTTRAGGGHAHVGAHDLPGRQLAGDVSQHPLHLQHPRPSRQ